MTADRIVQLARDRDHPLLHQRWPQRAARFAAAREHQPLQRCRLLQDERALIAVALRDLGQQLLQPPTRDRIVRGEIGAAEERRAIGGQEYGGGPPLQSRPPLDGPPVSPGGGWAPPAVA